MKKLDVTIAIPTYEAGDHLIKVLQAIYAQTAWPSIREVLIVVDGKQLSQKLHKQVTHQKLRVVTFPKRQGQSARLNDIFRLTRTELLVLTNDDVILDKQCVAEFIKSYKETQAGLTAGRVLPLPGKNLFEKILASAKEIDAHMAQNWQGGDNYLSCNGRLLALSRKFYRKLHIPTKIWNNDAYMYLAAKTKQFRFAVAAESVAYYKLPTTLAEHLAQSLKFQNSFAENSRHFKNLKNFYTVPKLLAITALWKALMKRPFLTGGFVGITALTRLAARISKKSGAQSSYWHTDISTKNLNLQHV